MPLCVCVFFGVLFAIDVLKFATLNDLFVVCMVVSCCSVFGFLLTSFVAAQAIVTMCCLDRGRERAHTISRNNQNHHNPIDLLTYFFLLVAFVVYLLAFFIWFRFYALIFSCSATRLCCRDRTLIACKLIWDRLTQHALFFSIVFACILCPPRNGKKIHDLLYSKWMNSLCKCTSRMQVVR